VTGSGTLWVKSTSPTTPQFTDDAGVSRQLATADADVQVTFQTALAATAPILTYALADNTLYRFVFEVTVRDTTTHMAKWTTAITYYRAAGGIATVLGGDTGDSAVDPAIASALVGLWVTSAPSTNSVVFSVTTSAATHLRWVGDLFVKATPIAAAT
jgi:hypothetical protein